MKSLLSSIIIIIFSYVGFNYINEFKIREVPNSIIKNYYSADYEILLPAGIYKMSVKEVQRKDAAAYISNLLIKNQKVLLPNTTIIINKDGLKIPSNSELYFDKNTLIKFSGPAIGKLSDIIKIYDVNNVKIYNAKIQGSRYVAEQSGEWSAGISILNSSNVTIENAHIYETWGDGIFIGSEDRSVSKNIFLNKIWIDKARRNAISITSAINTKLNNILVSNTHGTLPECGVDIEPSLFEDYVQKVDFENFYSFNNKNCAFNINLSALNSNERQYNPEISISLTNFYDKYSTYFVGAGFNNYNTKYTPKGKVIFKNGITFTDKHDINLDISKIKTNIRLVNERLKKSK